ncbi:MAG: GNAT family N-acetyltransferase [Clostridia bacterium]|jgi:ribosomal protein S18 acetylase RimI-like enzyme|nr:GNAT family N-acetyltransferase [Clostridia bacterium]MBO5206288.1 GNAT family N-acetyltransferase [Clostridia bacterium]MBP3582679.1 GNAT family N-acetyltransferase [Clostridia bacterium]
MISIRKAEPTDARALLLHINTVGKETDFLSFSEFNISEEREARFIRRFSESESDLMLIALDGERVVGNGVIERERIPRYSHRATLSLTVLSEYSGQGIGSSLMKELLDFSRVSGLRTVSLEVRADNVRAISLYRKFGFDLIGTYKDYFCIDGKYYDALIMQIILQR